VTPGAAAPGEFKKDYFANIPVLLNKASGDGSVPLNLL
jgi:hypothetical protein